MSTIPMKSEVETLSSGSASGDRLERENAVVFRGDGEPQSADLLLGRLVEIQSESGLSPDNYSLGGSVADLENHFAAALGKESAIYMPTGTLANHLAIRALCGGKPRAIVQEQSHLYHDCGDCVTQLSGINLVPLAKGECCFTLEELKDAVTESTSGRVLSSIGAVMIESPVRRQMGQVVPFQEMKAMTEYCRSQGIGTHLDGARLYMMSAASGTNPREYSALFDTVYVSLYKYFGAPYGAILAGDPQLIEGMFHTRRMFGGGLASSYFAAGLALKGTEGFEERLGAAMAIAFFFVMPFGIVQAAKAFGSVNLILAGIGVGICSSVIPYISDQLAMSRLPRASFALLLALLPATATIIGIVVLAQIPGMRDVTGVLLVMLGVAVHKPAAQ